VGVAGIRHLPQCLLAVIAQKNHRTILERER
jgi:hypothetical protein